jgi:hypothetical protein
LPSKLRPSRTDLKKSALSYAESASSCDPSSSIHFCLANSGTSNIPIVTASNVAAPVDTSVVTLERISFSGRIRRLTVIPG